MNGGAVFDQAVLIEVRAVAVRAGEGVAIRHRAGENKQNGSSSKSGMLDWVKLNHKCTNCMSILTFNPEGS